MSINRIVVTMDGGLIQHISADRPQDIQVIIVDYDVEGTSDETVPVSCSDGTSDEALISVYPVVAAEAWIAIAESYVRREMATDV